MLCRNPIVARQHASPGQAGGRPASGEGCRL